MVPYSCTLSITSRRGKVCNGNSVTSLAHPSASEVKSATFFDRYAGPGLRHVFRPAFTVRGWDPRLSVAGNRVGRQLAALLDQLARMTNWLRHHGRGDLALCDRGILEPSFVRLTGEAHTVAELTEDFVKEIHLP